MTDQPITTTLGRPRAGCVSELVLQRLRCGELDGTPARDRVQAHLESCGECRARAAAQAAETAPPLDVDRILAPRAVRRPAARRWAWVSLAGAFAAAAAVIVVARPPADTERRKGDGWRLSIIRRTPEGRQERLSSGATASPGDELRFEVRGTGTRYLAVLSVDASGAVTVFHPRSGAAERFEGGRPGLLTGAVVLDQVLGPERVLLLACPRPVPVADMTAAAERALRDAGSAQRLGALSIGCEEDAFWLRKETRR